MTNPALAITQPDGSRRYQHPLTGEVVPSVTTVLKVINKPQLINWAARMAATYAVEHWEEMEQEGCGPTEKVDRIRFSWEELRNTAADKGNEIHNAIDAWSKGEKHENPGRADASLNQFISWMMDAKPRFIETECTLWSRTHSYAGTADAIAEIGGEVVLLDWKTGKNVYPEAALQLAALAGCDFIIREDGTEEEIPALAKLAAVHIRPRSLRVRQVKDQGRHLQAFLACRDIVDWQENAAPEALEEAV